MINENNEDIVQIKQIKKKKRDFTAQKENGNSKKFLLILYTHIGMFVCTYI
jgi:hypothetical protein